MRILLASSAVAPIGDGRTGGVTRTIETTTRALRMKGHDVAVLAPSREVLGASAAVVEAPIVEVDGTLQPTAVSAEPAKHTPIVADGALARMWQCAFTMQTRFDRIVNLAHDWLPYYLTPFFQTPVFHLANLGHVDDPTTHEIASLQQRMPGRVAVISKTHGDLLGLKNPIVLSFGMDVSTYAFAPVDTPPDGGLVWAGRISPEKGLDDALQVAERLGETLEVLGNIDDRAHFDAMQERYGERLVHAGYLSREAMSAKLSRARALLQTQKWAEAFGIVSVEAMASGTPVIAYARGANVELVEDGVTGFLVPPDDIAAVCAAIERVDTIDRSRCRARMRELFSIESYADRVNAWLE
jgi:UDP-glucose:tetrahydrobiopterin glucosyltransferase